MKTIRWSWLWLGGFAFLLGMPSVSAETQSPNLLEVAQKAGNLNTFLKVVKLAGLAPALKGKTKLTVFAPTDKAFAAIPKALLKSVLQDKAKLRAILKYHVLATPVKSTDLLKLNQAQTLQGSSIQIGLTVNGKRVVRANLNASNGVIHIIDGVMLPQPKKLTKREKGLALIKLAIYRGVPLFNRGQRDACKAIYEIAVQSLLDGYSDVLSKSTQRKLRKTLDSLNGMRTAYAQAWALRYALNAASADLQKKPERRRS